MKILLISHVRNDPDGGSSRLYHMLAGALTSRGHAVTLLHLEDFGLPRARLLNRLTNRLLLPRYVTRGAMRYNPAGYDVIMASSGMAFPLFRRLRNKNPRPLLVNQLHGLAAFDNAAATLEAELRRFRIGLGYRYVFGPRQVKWDLAGAAAADITIVQNLRDFGAIEAAKAAVALVPSAVHPTLLAASQAAAPIEGREAGRLLWFGSWEARKGSSQIPRAFRLIRERRPDAILTVGGTAWKAADLLQQFDPADRDAVIVKSRIPIEEHISLLNTNSIFLFPSLSEGFGLAVVESMCFGLAAVTTNTAFGGDYLTDGVNARIVPVTAAHIARATLELMSDDAIRWRVAHAGQDLAKTFSLDRAAAGYEAVFVEASAATKLDRPR